MISSKANFKKLKFNIWLYFFVFTVILVFLVWIMQMVFFKSNYQNTRIDTMNYYADLISNDYVKGQQINNENILVLKESGISVQIFQKGTNDTIMHVFPTFSTVLPNEPHFAVINKIIRDLDVENRIQLYGDESEDNLTLLFSARKVIISDAENYVILLCPMSSLADTFKTLRFQLLISAIVVIIISLFASWIIAGKLSKPIDNMSEVAEQWANGDSNVVFEGGGYTEMEKLADTLNYAKDEISKTGNLQRDLMANVSHDLKTPLTMIKAYAELIKDISGDNKQKREKHTQIIIDEVDRLTLLVNDILNLSRLQSLVEQFNIQKINFSELVESVVYRFDTLVSNGGYNIVKEIQPDVFICADEKKMEEVVYNLVGNAINYTGEDKTVKVYLTTNNEKVTLEIIDSGKGINAEKMQTIWEKYYRVSETHHREVKGTGLGLSIVKAILDGHLFKYGIVSKEGCGSNFYIEIPVKEIQDE